MLQVGTMRQETVIIHWIIRWIIHHNSYCSNYVHFFPCPCFGAVIAYICLVRGQDVKDVWMMCRKSSRVITQWEMALILEIQDARWVRNVQNCLSIRIQTWIGEEPPVVSSFVISWSCFDFFHNTNVQSFYQPGPVWSSLEQSTMIGGRLVHLQCPQRRLHSRLLRPPLMQKTCKRSLKHFKLS